MKSPSGGRAAGKAPSATTVNVVPGLFTELDWSLMIEHDDADDLARTLVDELMSAVQQTIYDKHIERQLVPYTVHDCMKRAIDIVDWMFLAHDVVPSAFDHDHRPTGLVPDEEPRPGEMERWARGAVPTVTAARLESSMFDPLDMDDIAQISSSLQDHDTALYPQPETTQDDDTADTAAGNDAEEEEEQEETSDTAAAAADNVHEPTSYPAVERKSRGDHVDDVTVAHDNADAAVKCGAPAAPSLGLDEWSAAEPLQQYRAARQTPTAVCLTSLPSATTAQSPARPPRHRSHPAAASADNRLTSSQRHSLQLLHAPADAQTIPNKSRCQPNDIEFDCKGNVVSMAKISPAALPKDIVKVGFQVVEPLQQPVRIHRRSLMRDRCVPKPMYRPTAAGSVGRRPAHRASRLDYQPIVNAIKLSPGVVFSEDGRVKEGPQPLTTRGLSQTDLKPMKTAQKEEPASFSGLLENTNPVLCLPEHRQPLPPISANY